MIEIVKNFPDPMLMEPQKLGFSLFQPARPGSVEQAADQITFKNLLRELDEKLSNLLTRREVESWTGPLQEIKEDRGFWQESTGGMAIFSNGERTILYRFQEEPPPGLWVGEGFVVSPLIHSLQKDIPFYLLGLSLSEFRIFLGSRERLEEIQLPEGTARTLEEVVGKEHTEGFLTHGKYAGPGGNNAIFHGQGARKDEASKDLEKFFRHVDKVVTDEIQKEFPYPVILVSLTEHQGEFRKISANPHLHSQGIMEAFDPSRLDEQGKSAANILESENQEEISRWQEILPGEMAKGLGSDDPEEIQKAADEKRIRILILGHTEEAALQQQEKEILANEKTALTVIKGSGNVIIAEEPMITPNSRIGAIFRY